MPDAARDGRHGIGVAKGTEAQQKAGRQGSSSGDNKTAKDTGHVGKHRRD